MSKVLTDEANYTAIGNAIREKNGESTRYKPGDMAAAIAAIPTGSAAVIESKNITANGTYTAPTGVDGYNPVTVAVQPNLQSKTVTRNGTVTPDSGYDGLSSVVVNVSGGGATVDTIMVQGQVSNTSNYMSAQFDSGVDITSYTLLLFELYRDGSVVGQSAVKPTSLPISFFISGGSYTYQMRLTSTAIACTQYSGAYVDLFIDVTGINV